MALFNFQKPETREFNYKPRFYKPEEEASTGNPRRDLANEIHREWSSKRRHDKDKGSMPWVTIISMLFFAIVLGYIFYKFFS